ncbi:LPS assembly lipoprotein LptE [Luteolibacter arcticus]|uniref:LPS assembly lipoprotein LptE n=1 Tax=Luteolibacter arcticus TaxID=1581411 RepID=A0ABT3GL88_9BACT|nr:LPS assembly lipoprotein LptE [Luteolibacter arcticus]MCW1924231.1 LPS assembly lipoprotein LptE [Luteolibacter arcticus]
MRPLLLLLTALAFSSCAGYQLGGAKPAVLRDVKNITIPMFQNDTLHPRAEALATSAAADAVVLDGTYRITTDEKADAVLEGTVHRIEYTPLRSTRLDTLRPEELQNTVILNWKLTDARDRSKVLASGSSTGTSRFFVDTNLQTSRTNALPDALERASESMVSRLANGF